MRGAESPAQTRTHREEADNGSRDRQEGVCQGDEVSQQGGSGRRDKEQARWLGPSFVPGTAGARDIHYLI